MRDGVANTPEKRELVPGRRLSESPARWSACFSGCSTSPSWRPAACPLFLSDADLGDFVAQFVREAAEQELAPSGGRVALRGAPAPHPVRIDPEQLLRVLNNLKDNAVRYCRGRPPRAHPHRLAAAGPGVHPLCGQRPAGCRRTSCPTCSSSSGGATRPGAAGAARAAAWGCTSSSILSRPTEGTIQAKNDHGLVFELALPCAEVE